MVVIVLQNKLHQGSFRGMLIPKKDKAQLNIALWNWFQTAYQPSTNHRLRPTSQGKSLIHLAANQGAVWRWCFTFMLAETYRFVGTATGTEVTAKARLLFLACHPEEECENTEVPDGEIAVEHTKTCVIVGYHDRVYSSLSSNLWAWQCICALYVLHTSTVGVRRLRLGCIYKYGPEHISPPWVLNSVRPTGCTQLYYIHYSIRAQARIILINMGSDYHSLLI